MKSNRKKRCFGEGKPFYEDYQDNEWGVPVHDDWQLFEMLSLEGAQAGLSWEHILKRRKDYQKAFYLFEPSKVATMSDKELEGLIEHSKLIRNRRKIFSVRQNAHVVLEIQRELGSFDAYLWGFVNNQPIINQWKDSREVPCFSLISDRLSKDLKNRGMSFVGTKIIYAFMQAVGMVNDHLIDCSFR